MHIRILSPSGVIDPAYIDGASARLRAWGYKVSEGVHARDTWGRFAGTDENRVADIVDALEDENVDVILCARGGYGLQRIIDRLPAITKPVVGFSDITALHNLSALSGQSSLHAIMCKHLTTLPEETEPVVAFRKALTGEQLHYEWQSHPLDRPGKAEGVLIGGNLSVLYGLQGTPFSLSAILSSQPSPKPLLLIEDICERHYHIDRMMRSLRMSGVLVNIGGLIVGQFTNCEDDEMMNGSVYETIKEAVADYDYPVLFNAPFGHVEHNLPLWLNRQTAISCCCSGGKACIIQH